MEIEAAFAQILARLGDSQGLVRAVLSGRRRNMHPSAVRIDIRPVSIKDELQIQLMENDGIRTTTKNYQIGALDFSHLLNSGFANVLVESTEESLTLRITKKGEALLHIRKQKQEQNLSHDRIKNRLLQSSDPFLIEVGISDTSGKVKPSKQDKFRQVEEFLRLLLPSLNSALDAGHINQPTPIRPLEIVDLGCGHAYLTFAAHQLLLDKGLPTHVLGIDVREESRARNSAIAAKLGISSTIEFRAEKIADFSQDHVDVAIALHACDTATDDALAWAVEHGSSLILAAPCCHHDLQRQMNVQVSEWSIVDRHGLLHERLGDILTDSFRAHILRLLGYRVEIVEFVGGEHTPRNLMIRASKTNAVAESSEIEKYLALTAQWNVLPALEVRLAEKLRAVGVIRN